MILLGYLFTYLYIIFILLFTIFLNKKYNVKKDITRKIIHILVTFSWIIMNYFFKYTYHMIIPPLTFIIFNYISYKYNFLKSMENSESKGTIYYPVSVLLMAIFTFYNNNFAPAYAIGLFCMGLGDGFAPLIANSIKSKKIINNKTVSGSISVLIITLIVVLIFNYYFNLNFSLFEFLTIAVIATLIELIGVKGLDNLYLPLGISFLVYILGVI